MTLEHKKEDFSSWYYEVVRKGFFIDQRTPIKGCDVITPWGYAIWENIQVYADKLFKENGVKNVYFPLFIPKSLLEKEAAHFAGFVPEVAWVTRAGDKELSEWLAIRPTSETIMYEVLKNWISSYRDLPLKINQWCNVVRWETKATKPFLRSREFLWQEGHTLHATANEAERQVHESLEMYRKVIEGICALPYIILKRTERDKFAGAEYTLALEGFVPEAGRVLQLATVHNLGQRFAKAFDIKFKDQDEQIKYVYQTSWGFTTRLIGAIIAMHGDDKGAVLPPAISPYQVVIIPILYKGKEEEIMDAVRKIYDELKKMDIRVYLDDREQYTPGWKFNEWEVKGVPLRIEVGPKDLEKNGFTAVRRDTGERIFIQDVKEIPPLLERIQSDMRESARKRFEESFVTAETLKDVKKAVENKKFVRTFWCGNEECEIGVKEEIGAEIRGMRFDIQESADGKKCFYCGKEAKFVVYVAKSW